MGKKILLPSSPNWLTQKMKMVSSHTLHSSTDCAARHNLVANQKQPSTKRKIRKSKLSNQQNVIPQGLTKFSFQFGRHFKRKKIFKPKELKIIFQEHVKQKSFSTTWTFMSQQKVLI